ncbi:hypothetical protein PoB_006523900 [Plakobranchus ocellatus]|uniref:Uncharacterized protein n=1 Tax=Plakobranchus ocellatus TaxID=259542 RepID=A0AAV4D3L6_9GAST|nr:hypothetical protein PoB_006523900 [Plakobranchus ocellatus]
MFHDYNSYTGVLNDRSSSDDDYITLDEGGAALPTDIEQICLPRLLENWSVLEDLVKADLGKRGSSFRTECLLRMRRFLKSAQSKLYVVFLISALEPFDSFNTCLQCEEPMVHMLSRKLTTLMKSIKHSRSQLRLEYSKYLGLDPDTHPSCGRMDARWEDLKHMKDEEGQPMAPNLATFMQGLTIPHSSAH